MEEVKALCITCTWEILSANTQSGFPLWTDSDLRACFADYNGWSNAQYWKDCSLGLRRISLDIAHLGILKGTQDADKRAGIRDRAITQARSAGINVDAYQHHVVFVVPPPNDAGATTPDVVFDPAGSHAFYSHEFGHMLGLDHPFGWPSSLEYDDPYCVMGYTGQNSFPLVPDPSDAALTTNLSKLGVPDPGLRQRIPAAFWSADRMPSAATMNHYWADFASQDFVQRQELGFDTEVVATLTALSEYKYLPTINRKVLLVVGLSGGEELYVEYRRPTRWDYGIGVPTLVVHSKGRAGDERSAPNQGAGSGRIWFHGAISAPYYDEIIMDLVGVDVVAEDEANSTVTVRVRRPALRASVQLVEDRGRRILNESPTDPRTVWLNQVTDPNICSGDFKSYSCTIVRFVEEISLQVDARDFGSAVIEQVWVNDALCAPTGSVTRNVEATRKSVGSANAPNGQTLPMIASKTEWVWNTIDVQWDQHAITLTNRVGSGAFEVEVVALVRDASAPADSPRSRRFAIVQIHFNGERVDYDSAYRADAELCWWRRTHRHGELERPLLRKPSPPDWMQLRDKRVFEKLQDRLIADGKIKRYQY